MYSAFGAGCSEVEVNMLTGERRVLRADIMMDAGNSLSPAIDAGQVPLKTSHSFSLHATAFYYRACKDVAAGLCLKTTVCVMFCHGHLNAYCAMTKHTHTLAEFPHIGFVLLMAMVTIRNVYWQVHHQAGV